MSKIGLQACLKHTFEGFIACFVWNLVDHLPWTGGQYQNPHHLILILTLYPFRDLIHQGHSRCVWQYQNPHHLILILTLYPFRDWYIKDILDVSETAGHLFYLRFTVLYKLITISVFKHAEWLCILWQAIQCLSQSNFLSSKCWTKSQWKTIHGQTNWYG